MFDIPRRYVECNGICPEHGKVTARIEDWGRVPEEHVWTLVCPECDVELTDGECWDVREAI